jgi:hypothetical protein
MLFERDLTTQRALRIKAAPLWMVSSYFAIVLQELWETPQHPRLSR